MTGTPELIGTRGLLQAAPPPAAPPPSWLVGSALFPVGLVIGFTMTTLPFLLTRLGIPLHRVAETSAIVMSPAFWGFLLSPLLDTGLTRRAYGWLMATIAAVAVSAALWILSPAHLGAATGLLLIAELSMVLYGGSIMGWTTEFTPDSDRGSVGGWTNVANLGGGALGALVLMSLATSLPTRWLGLTLAGFILLGTTPTVVFPAPHCSSFSFKEIFTDAIRTTWQTCKRRDCALGFALFLAPAGSAAAINLFSALGQDFHASQRLVILVTGGGCAIGASLGALAGGYAANRIARTYLFLAGGTGTALTAIGLALLPHTPVVFVGGAILYSTLAGVILAAFSALEYQLVGQSSSIASTQLGLFSATLNVSIVYMTWADGQGYRYFGLRGLFLVDGVAALAAILPLFWLLHGHSLSTPATSGMQQEEPSATLQPLPQMAE